MMKKIVLFLLILSAILVGSFFYFRYQVYNSHGPYQHVKIFKVEKGEGNGVVAEKLEAEGLVRGNWYFYYYMRTHGLLNKILPGEYELSGKMTIPEIAEMLTHEQNKFVKVTFPEGWDSKKMAERLSANGFSGDGFLELVKNPPVEITQEYSFFSLLPKGVSLEGYLFPDTYFFAQKATPEDIVRKMLNNFDNRIDQEVRGSVSQQGKNLEDIITMASIIEREVTKEEDRKIVSGIFWNRIKNGQALQSCATISYILGTNKKQYSFEDTRIDSPYNTYINQGLPPAPISNPGLLSIEAALHPAPTAYNYFLSDPQTDATIFSKTIDEHNANKARVGL